MFDKTLWIYIYIYMYILHAKFWYIEPTNDDSLAVSVMIMISALPSYYGNIAKPTKKCTLSWNVVTHWSVFMSQANVLVLRLFAMHHSHKFNNTPVPNPTIHHSEQKCAHFCSEWCIVWYGTGALWEHLTELPHRCYFCTKHQQS